MNGSSRNSLVALLDKSDQMSMATLGRSALEPHAEEMLAVVRLLGSDSSFRNALTDTGVLPSGRAALAEQILSTRVSGEVAQVVAFAAGQPWARPRDLMDALELAALRRCFLACERENQLDEVEAQLFRFGKIVAANPQLRAALDDSQADVQNRVGLLHSLLGNQVHSMVLELLGYLVRNDRSRRFSAGLTELSRIARQQREGLTAQVSVSSALTSQQKAKLESLLGQKYGHRQVRLQVSIDPRLLGGAVVQVGHDLIDGSGKHRLHQIGRQLVAGEAL